MSEIRLLLRAIGDFLLSLFGLGLTLLAIQRGLTDDHHGAALYLIVAMLTVIAGRMK